MKQTNSITTLIAIALFLVSCGGGGNKPAACAPISKIFNGEACGKAHSVVLLNMTFSSGEKSSCTGTFISQTSILTAAHCLSKVNDLDKAVSVDITINGASTSYNSWHVPENYILSEFYGIFPGAFDVGIVKVDERFMPLVGAIPQPLLFNRRPVKGETLVISGYGLTEDGTFSLDQPRAAEVILTGIDETNRLVVIPGEGGEDTCFGDSGGPLLAKSNTGEFGITGVTSFGRSIDQNTSCGLGAMGFYTPIWNVGNSDFINSWAPDAIKF